MMAKGNSKVGGQGLYLVLGCGDVGFEVACRLKERGLRVVVVDKDARIVEHLKLVAGHYAFLGDFCLPEVLKQAGIARAEVVVLAVQEFSTTRKALDAINRLKAELEINPVVIARVGHEMEATEVKLLGASDVVPSVQVFVDSLLKTVYDVRAMAKERQLRALLRDVDRLAIVLRNDPSPDGIASGVAMKRYARAFGVDADVIYAGPVSRQLGRAMVRLLELELLPVEKVKFEDYAGFALVGVATHANCALPRDILPTIVIDNHPVPLGEVRARFCDIRQVGATSTLLTNYLGHAAVELDEATATALAIGILSNTRSFTKGATPLDLDTLEYLLPRANTDLLQRLYFHQNTESEKTIPEG